MPFSTQYIMQYLATLDSSNYAAGLSKMGNQTEKINNKIGDSFSKGSDKVKKSNDAISVSTAKTSVGYVNLSGKAAMAIAAITAISARTIIAVKDFAKFQQQMNKVNTLLKVSRKDLSAVGDEILQLAISTGKNKDQIAEGMYQALSAGVNPKDALEFMTVATKTSISGYTSVTTAVDALTTVINAYKLETKDASKIADIFLKGQELGKITVDEIGKSIGSIAPMAASANVNIENLIAGLSTMTANGIPASEAATMIKAALGQLLNTTTTAAKTFKTMTGVTFVEFIKQGNSMQDAFNIIDAAAIKTDKSIVELMGGLEAGNGVLALTGINAQKAASDLGKVANASGTLEEAYKLATDNIAHEWGKTMAIFNKGWMSFVATMEPTIRKALRTFNESVGNVSNNEKVDSRKLELESLKKELEEAKIKAEKHKNPTGILTTADLNYQKTLEKRMKLEKEIIILESEIRKENFSKSLNEYLEHSKNLENLTLDNYKGKEKELYSHLKSMSDIQNNLINNFGPEVEGQGKKDLEKDKIIIDERIKILEKGFKKEEEIKLKKIKADNELKALKSEKETSEKEHTNKIILIDTKYLEKKKDFIENLNLLLKKGELNQETYNEKLEKFNKDSNRSQSLEQIDALKTLRNFYKSIDDLHKINELDKKIIEIEVKLTGLDSLDEDTLKIAEFQQKQLDEQKAYKDQQLIREWDFLEEIGTMRLQGELNEQEFNQRINDYRYNQGVLANDFDIEQLEKKRNFYLNEMDMQERAIEIQEEIIEKRKKLSTKEKYIKDTEVRWNVWAEKRKVDIQEASADALLDTYNALATGQIKSMEDFKLFAQQQISNLLAQKGSEHAAIAISDTAKGISFAANPLTASLAPPEFASAAHNASIAAAFGIAAAISAPSSDSSNDDNHEHSTQKEETDNFTDSVAKAEEFEGDVYIDVSDSSMAKIMIKNIEKELNDGYNVTLIGKKKR